MQCFSMLLVLLSLFCGHPSAPQTDLCNRVVRYNSLKSKLDAIICIPPGHQIMKIYDVDLNADNRLDKIVRWQKIKLSDGDTIFHSIYLRAVSGKLQLNKILNNLMPLYFDNYSSESGNKFYDSIKSIYSYPTLWEVQVDRNIIELKFYIDAVTQRSLMFLYSSDKKIWVLNKRSSGLHQFKMVTTKKSSLSGCRYPCESKISICKDILADKLRR
jgi:hypothetical protein